MTSNRNRVNSLIVMSLPMTTRLRRAAVDTDHLRPPNTLLDSQRRYFAAGVPFRVCVHLDLVNNLVHRYGFYEYNVDLIERPDPALAFCLSY